MRKGSRTGREQSSADLFPSSSDDSQIRCICGAETDDGFTIQCESCLVWQHASCVGIGKSNIPEKYFCEICAPPTFSLHKQRAATVENFVKTESLIISSGSGKEVFHSLVQPLAQALEQTSSLSLHVYCPLSLEPLKISRSQNEASQSSSFPSFFFIKPIKARGYQRRGIIPKFGIFSKIHLEPGRFLCEFTGEAKLKDSFAGVVPSVCLQTFVLFIQNTPIAVDARRVGNLSRFIRRSCRPNVQIELLIKDPASRSLSAEEPPFSVRLLAMNNIYEGEEIFLPNDFDFGNSYFKYDCACGNPEFCLSSCLFGSFIFNAAAATSGDSAGAFREKAKNSCAFPPVAEVKEQQTSPAPEAIQHLDAKEATIPTCNDSISLQEHTATLSTTLHSAPPKDKQEEEEETKTIVDILTFGEEEEGEKQHDSMSVEESQPTSSNEIPQQQPAESTTKHAERVETPVQQPAAEETSPSPKVKLSLSDYIRLRKSNPNAAVEAHTSEVHEAGSCSSAEEPGEYPSENRLETRSFESHSPKRHLYSTLSDDDVDSLVKRQVSSASTSPKTASSYSSSSVASNSFPEQRPHYQQHQQQHYSSNSNSAYRSTNSHQNRYHQHHHQHQYHHSNRPHHSPPNRFHDRQSSSNTTPTSPNSTSTTTNRQPFHRHHYPNHARPSSTSSELGYRSRKDQQQQQPYTPHT